MDRLDQYFIGISLPNKEKELFSFVKQQFHPKGKLSSPPHITLIPPFIYENEQVLLDKLKIWSQGFRVFEVNIFKVGSFRRSKKGTVFLEPENSEELYNIYLSLCKLLEIPVRGFVAHLSLAQQVPLGAIDEVQQKITDMKLGLKLKIIGVSVYKRKAGENWQDFKIIPFESGD